MHQSPPIFIGGHHRSGTTLMRVMLNRHPHIACGPEGALLERTGFREFHHYLESAWMRDFEQYGFGPAEIDQAVAAFMNSFFTRYAEVRKKERWAEKTPRNILRIEYLFRLFPQARFIHMIRDPRDVHCSVREKAATTTARWSTITAVQTARSWVEYVERGISWQGDDRYLEVRYEQLVVDPVSVMRTVLAFVNEPWDDRVLATNANATDQLSNVDRPVFNSSVQRWQRDLSEEDREQIEVFASDTMRKFGYSTLAPRQTHSIGNATVSDQ